MARNTGDTRRATSGKWSPSDEPRYFFAGRESLFALPDHCHSLMVPRQITTELVGGIKKRAATASIMIDSGVWTLLAEHARTHQMTMTAAARLAPDHLDGHDDMLEKYLIVARALSDEVWGTIEWDAGAVAHKRARRSELHEAGLDPIPVWHATTDHLDYLDELAGGYQRIAVSCYGTTSPVTRARLMHAVTAVLDGHPPTWVHQLGISPAWWHMDTGYQSCDSSTYTQVMRWPGFDERIVPRPLTDYHHRSEYRTAVVSALSLQALDTLAVVAAVDDQRTAA